MNHRCIYFVEGECEEQLILALKEQPSRLIPGKIKKLNVNQKLIPNSVLISIQRDTYVALAYDTDVPSTEKLQKNIELLKKHCSNVKIIHLAQVLNFEDELVRCSDLIHAQDFTHSKTVADFKHAFSKMKPSDCRISLERHQLDVGRLWTTPPPNEFAFIESNSSMVKNTAL